MSYTPRTDAALAHQGGSHQDVITRLERLIPISRALELENAELREALEAMVKVVGPMRAPSLEALKAYEKATHALAKLSGDGRER
jgi:hypothetical protein